LSWWCRSSSVSYFLCCLSPLIFLEFLSRFFAMFRPPPTCTLFPYTTLFRSPGHQPAPPRGAARGRKPPPGRRPRRDRAHLRHPEIGKHTSELQSPDHLVCRLLLEKKKAKKHKRSALTTHNALEHIMAKTTAN